jgi:hypothetical protein
MKHLKAHFKYAMNNFKDDEMDRMDDNFYKFDDQCNSSSCIGFTVESKDDGWTVTPNKFPFNVCIIYIM